MVDLYAVMGNPIEHSISPQLHQLFAECTKQELAYEKILVKKGSFEDEVRKFQLRGGKGLNITLPCKQLAFAYVDKKTSRAELAGAVNTIIFQANAECIGDNTDGSGLVRDVTQNHKLSLKQKRILILGAGGATRGIIAPILAKSPAQLHIANRTPAKAQQLAQLFAHNPAVTSSGLHDIPESYDVVINATSSSLRQELPNISRQVFAENCCCYDMMYAREPTLFLHWAEEQGVSSLYDGLGMLVEQAAESFYLWHGVMPETSAVIVKARKWL